ncbi:MAG: dihydropteroate synthase, partial [Calditerrivibrio sp.]|nr:dihydropteroate synthase [Calditerrivibrio sp.]
MNNFPSMFADIISPDKMRLEKEITDLGADPYALKIASKGLPCNIKLRKVKSPAANIIKQEAIASGIDAAVHKRTVECGVEYTDILLCGNVAGVRKL